MKAITLDLLIDLFYFCHSIKNLNYINKTDPYVLIQTHEAFEDDELNFFIKNVNLSNLILMLRDPVKSLDSHYYHLKMKIILISILKHYLQEF